jgi:uncharacterized protein with HEPN domain
MLLPTASVWSSIRNLFVFVRRHAFDRFGYPNIPWTKIVGVRVMIKHEYHRIDPEIIWDVATIHLRPLQEVITRMLADLD